MKNGSGKNWCLWQGYKRNSLFPLKDGSDGSGGFSLLVSVLAPWCLAASLANTREQRGNDGNDAWLCVGSQQPLWKPCWDPGREVQVVGDGPWHQGKAVWMGLGTSSVLRGRVSPARGSAQTTNRTGLLWNMP